MYMGHHYIPYVSDTAIELLIYYNKINNNFFTRLSSENSNNEYLLMRITCVKLALYN